MEEILASIRRIISEDDAPASTSATSASAPAAAPVKADSDDVLELTQRAEPSPFAAEPEVAPTPAPEPKKRGKAASPFARFEKGGDEEDETKYDDSRFDTSMFDKTDIELVAPEAEVAPPTPPAPEPAPQPVVAAQPAPQPQPVAQAMPSKDEGLISQPTATSVANAFGALSRNVPMPPPGRSLEDLVKEMMKPMLREWLDANLAGIVEAKVQAEVERLSRQL